MKFRHYIWDFDGTLADSYPHIIACFETVLREENLPIDHEELEKQFYDNFAAAKEYSGISEKGYRKFSHLHHMTGKEAMDPPITAIDGVVDILKRITELGGDNYVFTNRNDTCIVWCRDLGFDDYISGYVTSKAGFAAKPCPDALNYLMEKYSLKAEDCVMIGDREIDGESGKNAGMAGCLVTDFPIDKNGLDPREISKMDFVCRHVTDLYDMFEIK